MNSNAVIQKLMCEVDVDSVKLLRRIAADLMSWFGITAVQAEKEIISVLRGKEQIYPGNYKAKLKSANIICNEARRVIDKTELLAVDAIVENLTVKPRAAFAKVSNLTALDLESLPFVIRRVQVIIIKIAADVGRYNGNVTDIQQELATLRKSQAESFITDGEEYFTDDLDPYVIDNVFTESFTTQLNNQLNAIHTGDLNYSRQGFKLQTEPFEYYSLPPISSSTNNLNINNQTDLDFTYRVVNHMNDYAAVYGVLSLFVVLAYICRDQIKYINPFRPLVGLYNFICPGASGLSKKNENEQGSVQVITDSTPYINNKS